MPSTSRRRIRTWAGHTGTLAALAALAGCASPVTLSDVVDGGGETGRSDANDASDAFDARDAIDAGDAADATADDGASDVPIARDLQDLVDTTDVADAPDAADVTDAPDAADGADGGDAATCPAETPHGSLTPSTSCSASAVTIDPASLCPGASACPVSSLHRLRCSGGGYGPWVAPSGPAGGSVLFVTNSGSFVSRLFTFTPASPPRVDDVPSLTAAANVLVADRAGNRVLIAGEMPGTWRVRETPTGWLRESAFGPEPTLSFPTDARAIDDRNAFVAYFDVGDERPHLATRDATCWRQTVLPGTRNTFMSMDVDTTGRPWVAWFSNDAGGSPNVQLIEPDRTARTPWTGAPPGGFSLQDRPLVVANGLAGTSMYPALAFQRSDGTHVLAPDATLPRWTDRLVPRSAIGARTGDCPGLMGGPGGCGSATTCTMSRAGAVTGLGFARTSAGRTFVGWTESVGSTDYSLMTMCGGPPICRCIQTPTTSRGTATVVLVRVDASAFTEVLRVRFDVGAEVEQSAFAMTARGTALLFAVGVGAGDTDLRYFEVDTTRL